MKACRREPTPRTPIWLMRQAGRYMKSYRDLRARVGFLDLCKNSDLCAEVTVDAAHKLGVDAAIIFSDLLLIVQPMGFELSYGADQGPVISNPVREEADLKRLKPVDPQGSLSYVMEAIKKTRSALRPDLPLLGFAGAPFTMASYLIEGRGKKELSLTIGFMRRQEKAWDELLDALVTATAAYLNAQIEAGAQAVQIFDSWVGCLHPDEYRRYVGAHTERLIQSLPSDVPVIHFGTKTGALLSAMKDAGGAVIGVDWRTPLDKAWELISPEFAIMGNLDPAVLLSTQEEIESETKLILDQAAGRPGHIFNLGHGVMPGTPEENVHFLVEKVKALSQKKPAESVRPAI